MSDDVFYRISMNMNVDQDEIAKIVHDYIERGIINDCDRLNCPKPPIYIGPVKVKSLKERLEETKMKATSTETFHDIIAIDFELQTFPNPDVQDKFIVSATNRDDIFAFVFEGPCLRDACKNAGLFVGWEKDQKIKELEEELSRWKKEAADCLKLRDESRKENKELEKKIKHIEKGLDLEKAANEAQRKFIKEYTGKDTEVTFNYAIGSGHITYGLYDKDYVDELRKKNNNLIAENVELKAKLCYKAKSSDDIKKLKEQIKKLELLKTPTIENFEEPSDNVNHPSHYTGRYECIDVMHDVFGNEATDNFCLCNAFKYIWRANKKNGLEDVKKAVWYLNKYIEEAENGVPKGK